MAGWHGASIGLRSHPWKRRLLAATFLAPSFVVFTVFVYYPLLETIRDGLYRTDPFGRGAQWVGFEQYLDVLGSGDFRHSLWVTVLFTLLTVPTGLFLGLVLALLAHQRLRGITIFRTIFSSTIASSIAVASVMWLVLLDPSIGVVAWFSRLVGLEPIRWFQDPQWALIGVSLATIWANLSFTFLISIAGLQSLPEEILDATRVDGAGPLRRTIQVVMPLLSPTLFFSTVVLSIISFQSFGQIDLLTQGGPRGATNVIVFSIYETRFEHFDTGTASAQAVLLFLIILSLTLFQFRFVERRVHYGAS